jgi:hypothetical protein
VSSSDPQPPTADELDAYIRTRLAIAGVDLGQLPTEADPVTGAPTQAAALSSLRAFVSSTPGILNGWSPPPAIAGDPAAAYAQQTAPPIIYPSITTAWTAEPGKAAK